MKLNNQKNQRNFINICFSLILIYFLQKCDVTVKIFELDIFPLPYNLQLTLVWNRDKFPRPYCIQKSAIPSAHVLTQDLRLSSLLSLNNISQLFYAILKVVVYQYAIPKQNLCFQIYICVCTILIIYVYMRDKLYPLQISK